MPNWVTNKLSIRGTDNQIEQILSAIAEKEKTDAISRSPIDFNNIIPMPADLNVESGSRGHQGLEYIIGLSKSESREEVCKTWDSLTQEERIIAFCSEQSILPIRCGTAFRLGMSGVLKIGVRNGMPAMLQRVVILFFSVLRGVLRSR